MPYCFVISFSIRHSGLVGCHSEPYAGISIVDSHQHMKKLIGHQKTLLVAQIRWRRWLHHYFRFHFKRESVARDWRLNYNNQAPFKLSLFVYIPTKLIISYKSHLCIPNGALSLIQNMWIHLNAGIELLFILKPCKNSVGPKESVSLSISQNKDPCLLYNTQKQSSNFQQELN